jgi:dipeptidyl aminopeptidase/acylaminoacyl peptidase
LAQPFFAHGPDPREVLLQALLELSGEAIQLTKVETGVQGFEWSPDGKTIAFTASDPESKESKDKKDKDKKEGTPSYLASLSGEPRMLEEIARLCGVRRVRKGELLFSEGDPAGYLPLLLSGQVKLLRIAPEGREQVLHLVRAPASSPVLPPIPRVSRAAGNST